MTPGVPSVMSTGCAGIPPEERPKGKVERNRTAPVKTSTCLQSLYTNKAAPIRSSARYFGTSLAMSIGFQLVPLLQTLIFISTMGMSTSFSLCDALQGNGSTEFFNVGMAFTHVFVLNRALEKMRTNLESYSR